MRKTIVTALFLLGGLGCGDLGCLEKNIFNSSVSISKKNPLESIQGAIAKGVEYLVGQIISEGFVRQAETGVFETSHAIRGLRKCLHILEDNNSQESLRNLTIKKIATASDWLLSKKRPLGWIFAPNLPPDLDDMASSFDALFIAIDPTERNKFIQNAFERQNSDGGIPTWLIPEGFAVNALKEKVHSAVDTVDPEVMAYFLRQTVRDPKHDVYKIQIQKGAGYLAEKQLPDGSWESTWYFEPTYSLFRVGAFLAYWDIARYRPQLASALSLLIKSRNTDGFWGRNGSNPLATSFAVLFLTEYGWDAYSEIGNSSIEYLLKQQTNDGSWPAFPYFGDYPVSGSAQNFTHKSSVYTTAIALEALCGYYNSHNGPF